MKARVEVDIWFDVDNWTETEFKDVIEDAIDAYNGSADVRSIKLVPDEDDDEAPVQYVIGYLDFDGFEHKITETGYDEKGKYYDIITKSGGVHRVWDSYVMVTNVQLH
ncbi:hypothetical protein NIGALANA_186 [Bacillus phage Nigalana]|uniref:Uncharacterized protein n=1 Tax=Bacillus phage DirtyBetty TaxID=1873999 RepID=A0A1B1PAZ0_9CAUD|nr:hypothetical protein BI005_gp186 [Bacillus phage Nigalana]YP_009285128.1 hypothetical protein BIZ88_gp186 [Bacillus phage DirtyBetty]AOZ62430.1 hypothetical protein SBP8a_180 [Bacillus phage SBP8a]AUV57817.1 hypothetical protein HONESTABE_180 [Bacillus phage HonestAbe]AXQ67451.1 hypothetical protein OMNIODEOPRIMUS_184 [Bacillus phage OmnioDeoPrimus]AMW61336.1 hypothetical protein NIGALANA_186 [Bacillus phage Nigalana]ANT41331.1 hypothetical protein DIRTYBETTY_186 [Bacillus phage DirtyBetty